MTVSRRFKALLVVFAAITLGVKLLTGSVVQNPDANAIYDSITPALRAQGFEIAGQVSFAGRDALLVRRESCIAYLLSVAHQGWHEQTILQNTPPDARLFFIFKGQVFPDRQPRFWPLLDYYAAKALRSVSPQSTYPPVIALVASGECSLGSVDWKTIDGVPFATH